MRVVRETGFTLPLDPSTALKLFTPEGERRWAGESWNPVYAEPDGAQDDSAPGTVFTTSGEHGTTTWIVIH